MKIEISTDDDSFQRISAENMTEGVFYKSLSPVYSGNIYYRVGNNLYFVSHGLMPRVCGVIQGRKDTFVQLPSGVSVKFTQE